MTMTGRFVVFEGIDRSGKTSVCRMVKEKLENTNKENNQNSNTLQDSKYICNDVGVISFPNRKSITANRWEMCGKIEERSEKIILCDRYFYSGIAYTAAKGVDFDWCRQPDKGLPKPDLVVFIDLKPEEACKRPGFGTEKYEKIEYLQSVYKTLRNLVEEEENGIVVDGNRSLEKIVEEIVARIIDLY